MVIYAAAGISGAALGALASWLRGRVVWPAADAGGARRLGGRLPAAFRQRYLWLFLLAAVASLLPAALVSGFRYGIGTDYFYTYVPYFDGVFYEGLTPNIGLEPGIWLVMKLVQLLGGWHLAFFTTCALFTSGFFWAGMLENSTYPWYSIALFFLTEAYFVSMNATQQYMALAIVFLGLRYVKTPCFWKYALCVLAGTMFHYSTVLLLPLYVFIHVRAHPAVGLGAAAAVSAANPLLQRLVSWALIHTPYGYYVGSEYQQTARVYPGKLVIAVVVLAVAAWYFLKPEHREKPLLRFLFYAQLCCVFLLMNRNIVPLADRIVWDLEAFQLLLIPLLASYEKNRWLRWAILLLPAALWARLCGNEIFRYGWHEVVPYVSVFSSLAHHPLA